MNTWWIVKSEIKLNISFNFCRCFLLEYIAVKYPDRLRESLDKVVQVSLQPKMNTNCTLQWGVTGILKHPRPFVTAVWTGGMLNSRVTLFRGLHERGLFAVCTTVLWTRYSFYHITEIIENATQISEPPFFNDEQKIV